MKKKIKSKKVDSVYLFGKIIGIYQKHKKQISKVLIQPSIVELYNNKKEVNLGEEVFLKTDVNLTKIRNKNKNFKKKAG